MSDNPAQSKLLTPEQGEYKNRTLEQLLNNQPILLEKLAGETRPAVQRTLRDQIEEIEAHIERLQQELSSGLTAKSTADELCIRIAGALTKEKFFMAKKYIGKLETIEPFYPGLDRLRQEAEEERISRKVRAIAQGTAPPFGAAIMPPGEPAGVVVAAKRAAPVANLADEPEKKGWFSQLFQFHIVASFLVAMLVICVMLGVGGMMILQWLFQGG